MQSLLPKLFLTTLYLFLIAHRIFAMPVNPSVITTTDPVSGRAMVYTELTPAGTQLLDSSVVLSQNPISVITSLEPSKVIAGSGAITLIVRGSGFLPQSEAILNEKRRSTRFIDSSELRLVIPASILNRAWEIRVVIYNPPPGGGSSSPAILTVENPIPTITSITPTSKAVGDGAFTLLISGTHFVEQSEARFDGVWYHTRFINTTRLHVEVPSSELALAREISITIFNPSPGGGLSNAMPFVVLGGSISGNVYDDLNGNGFRDEGEKGLSSWTVWLMKNDVPVASTLITSAGDFAFIRLALGTYKVRVRVLPGWILTQPSQLSEYTVRLVDSLTASEIDFGVFKDGRISGYVFNDRNENGIREADEEALPGIRVRVQQGTDGLSTETQNDGTFSLSHLLAGVYKVRLNLDSGWIQTYPNSEYRITVLSGTDTSGIGFGIGHATRDTEIYRTLLPESISVSRAIRRKPCATKFYFEFLNQIEQHVDGLYVEFVNHVTSITLAKPFTTVRARTQSNHEFDFTGAMVAKSQVAEVVGFGPTSGMRVKRWWWTYNGSRASVQYDGLLPIKQEFLLPMPNGANLRNEIFLRMPYQTASSILSAAGLIIGVQQPSDQKLFGWVKLRKSSSVVHSMSGPFGQHVGEPRGFDTFNNGRPFVGEQQQLPPSKQNNRLFADLLTMKLNISASELRLTPNGFGELLFEEKGNPLNGMMVREIAAHTDTILTGWLDRPQAEYRNLDSTIRKINVAFSGPFDTVSFGSHLRFTGARKLSDVPFLRKNPYVVPRAVITPSVAPEEVPVMYRLEQNYPNPFNPTTIIEFEIAQPSVVTLKIFNMLGQDVTTLFEEEWMAEGHHSIELNGMGMTSGVYFYRIVALADNDDEKSSKALFTSTRKMLLIK